MVPSSLPWLLSWRGQVMEGVHWWVSSFKDFFKSTALPEVVKAKDNTPQTVLLTSCRNFLERVERAGAKTVEVSSHTPHGLA